MIDEPRFFSCIAEVGVSVVLAGEPPFGSCWHSHAAIGRPGTESAPVRWALSVTAGGTNDAPKAALPFSKDSLGGAAVECFALFPVVFEA